MQRKRGRIYEQLYYQQFCQCHGKLREKQTFLRLGKSWRIVYQVTEIGLFYLTVSEKYGNFTFGKPLVLRRRFQVVNRTYNVISVPAKELISVACWLH